jgi:polar amino acid transport system substrate-binding protein
MGKLYKYIRPVAYFILSIIVLFGGYRACLWVLPPAPDVYKIAIDSTWYPLSLYGKDSAFTAFSIDVLFAIAKREKVKVEIVRSGPKRLLELLDDGQVHGILTGIRKQQVPEEQYYFSEPYYRFGGVLIIRKNDSFSSLMDLPSKRIAVKRNSPILFRVQIDPRVSVIPFDSPVAALDQLMKGDLDGVIMDQLLAYLYFAGVYQDQMKVVTLPLTMDGLHLMTLQDDVGEGLIEVFNEGLQLLKEDGTYLKFLKQWDLYDPEVIQNGSKTQ